MFLIQDQGAAFGWRPCWQISEAVQLSYGERQHDRCILLMLVESHWHSQAFISVRRHPVLMLLLNPNTCSKALPMNTIVKVGFCPLKTSKKGLSVNEFWRVHILFKSAWLWYFYYYFWNHQKRRLLRSLILGLLFSSCTKCFLWSYSGL